VLFALEVALSTATGLCILGIAPVLCRLLRKTTIEDITPEWVESFSVERYRPMLGLLAKEDFAFLSRQPGFDHSIYKKLRRERLCIFEQYLARLILDFKKLHATARYFVARSQEDRTEAAMQLIRLRWAFSVNVVEVYLRLQLCRIGIGTAEAQAVVARLQQMSDQLTMLTLPQAA
jgi:hypothetical protein